MFSFLSFGLIFHWKLSAPFYNPDLFPISSIPSGIPYSIFLLLIPLCKTKRALSMRVHNNVTTHHLVAQTQCLANFRGIHKSRLASLSCQQGREFKSCRFLPLVCGIILHSCITRVQFFLFNSFYAQLLDE